MWREDDVKDNCENHKDAEHATPMYGPTDDVTDKGGSKDKTQQLEGNEFDTADTTAIPKGYNILATTAVTHECPQERTAHRYGEQGGDDVCPGTRQHAGNERFAKVEHQGDNCHTENTIDEYDDTHMLKVGTPAALLLFGLRLFLIGSIALQLLLPPLRQDTFHNAVGGCGKPYHIRRGERGEDRYCHDNGIEEVTGDMQGGAERGKDKGKLATI